MATLVERRRFMQALAAASAVPAAAAAQAPASAAAPQDDPTPVVTTLHDAVAVGVPTYFDQRQISTLRRLGELMMPAMDGMPSAPDAGVPEFLDFYVGQSSEWRRQLYRAGLDTLHSQSLERFGKPFADISDSQADEIIAKPLAVPYSNSLPADTLAAFLREAKIDILNATTNSREYAEAAESSRSRSRRSRSSGSYLYTIE